MFSLIIKRSTYFYYSRCNSLTLSLTYQMSKVISTEALETFKDAYIYRSRDVRYVKAYKFHSSMGVG